MDGRKHTIMLFGRFDNTNIYEFYSEIMELMYKDNIEVTHLSCGKIGQSSWNIRKAKYVRKRYEEVIKNNPEEILSLSVMNIEDNAKFPPNYYLFNCGFIFSTRNNGKNNKNKYYNNYCCELNIDFSIKHKVSVDEYREVLRKCSNWYKEVIFDCGKGDIPQYYTMFQKTNLFKKFKLISETINGNYIKYDGDDI